MKKIKTWVILGLAFLVAGFWCNLVALQTYLVNDTRFVFLWDVLPLDFSIGDCFLLVGYGVFALLLGWGLFRGAGKLVLKSWMVKEIRAKR